MTKLCLTHLTFSLWLSTVTRSLTKPSLSIHSEVLQIFLLWYWIIQWFNVKRNKKCAGYFFRVTSQVSLRLFFCFYCWSFAVKCNYTNKPFFKHEEQLVKDLKTSNSKLNYKLISRFPVSRECGLLKNNL